MTKEVAPPTPLHHEPDLLGKMDRIPTFVLIEQPSSDAVDVPARRSIAHLCKHCGSYYSPTSRTVCAGRIRTLLKL
jgi:hypothetical protein